MKFTADDNIMIKGELAAAGSVILSNYRAPFSATVFERLQGAGLEFVGQTKADEFSVPELFSDMGDMNEDAEEAADFSDRVPDAISHVAGELCDIALCNDVFGRLRLHAPKHGLYYIHPTYGAVSRFGLIPAISSMDQIGIVCRSLEDGFKVLSIISDHSETRDSAGLLQPDALKIGLPMNAFRQSAGGAETGCIKAVQTGLDALSSKGLVYDTFELEYLDVLHQTHYILACAEICNNTNRYDGIKFGYRTKNYTGLNDLYLKTRTEALGLDLKLTSIMGCMVLSKENYETYYLKAMQVRRLIRDYCDDLFSQYDVLAMPLTVPGLSLYEQSGLYALAALAGLPSVSVPYNKGVGGDEVQESWQRNGQCTGPAYGDSGIQLIARRGNEGIFQFLYK